MSKYYDFNRFFQIEGEDSSPKNKNLISSIKTKKTKLAARVDNYFTEYESGSQESLTQDFSNFQILQIINTAMHIGAELAFESREISRHNAEESCEFEIDDNSLLYAVQTLGRLETETECVSKYKEPSDASRLLDKIIKRRRNGRHDGFGRFDF